MITTHDILWGILYPALLTAVVMVIAHAGRRGPRDTHGWGVPLAIAAGLAVAYYGISGRFALPPTEAQQWPVIAAAGALVLSIIASLHERMRWAVFGLSIALLMGMTWMLAANRRAALSPREFWLTIAFIAGGLVLWYVVMEPLSARHRGATLPLLLAAIAGAGAMVIVNGGSQRFGQILGGVAVALLLLGLMGLWLRDLSLSRGGILSIAVAVPGLLAAGYLYAPTVNWPEVAILAAAPLLAWASQLPFVRSRRPWLRFAITAALVLGVAAIAAVPAARGLRKTMQGV